MGYVEAAVNYPTTTLNPCDCFIKLSGDVSTKCRAFTGNVRFSNHNICCIIETSIIVSHNISSDSCCMLRSYSVDLDWNAACRCRMLIVVSKSFLGTKRRYDLGTTTEFSSHSISSYTQHTQKTNMK
jgi:hypothetical protein